MNSKAPGARSDVSNAAAGPKAEWRHKISDWEAGALYWNVARNHGEDWQTPFRKKLERELLQRDLMFLMGTLHRFPEQGLIVSLIYPPKRLQQSLL
jgi:hypothetical protein